MNKHIEEMIEEKATEFDERFSRIKNHEFYHLGTRLDAVIDLSAEKDFIRTAIKEGYQRGREDEREELKETNLVELAKKMEEELQEHADMHGEFCPCNAEDPDACDCEEMKFWTKTIKDWMGKVNQMWVGHLQEHRKHCTPEGRKDLTRIKRIISHL